MPAAQRIVALAGRLGKDPFVKETPNGKTVVSFSIAVTTSYPNTELGLDGTATWFQVSVWNEGLQDFALASLSKGNWVAVEGAYSERDGSTTGDKFRDISASKLGTITFAEKTVDPRYANKTAPAKAAPAAIDDLPF